jgi:hypothetical protein
MTTGTCIKKFKVKKYSASLPLDPRMRMSSKETQSSVNTGLLSVMTATRCHKYHICL